MKFCFVGLGNCGKVYENTRHNIGFIVIDRLSKHLSLNSFLSFKSSVLWNKKSVDDKEVYLVKPYNYMNNSGPILKTFCDCKKISVKDLIVIYDDIDTEIGKFRIRKSGTSGGHKGMESVINVFGTKDIVRIRIGIGPKPKNVELSCYVLSDFKSEEMRLLDVVMDRIIKVFDNIINRGIDYTISSYNINT